MNSFHAVATPVDDNRLFNLVGSLLGGAVILGLALLVAQIALDHFRDPARFPIHRVVVEGDYRHSDQNLLKEQVLSEATRGFFNLDIAGIQQKVQKLPWVDKAYVRRIWPESISVTLEEHHPVARWNKDGLISGNYELFHPPGLENLNDAVLAEKLAQLPSLSSPYRRHVAMFKLFNEIKPILDSGKVPLAGIIEDERRSVSLQLQGGLQVIVGHRDLLERTRRFARIFETHVAPVYDDVLRVDMRHTNGFAMAHKSTATTASGAD